MKAPLFLRAKHWQIFVPALAIPFVSMIAFMAFMIATIVSDMPEGSPDRGDLKNMSYIMPLFVILSFGTQFLWIWNVAANLREYILSDDRKPRIKLFRVTFFFPIIYLCVMPLLVMNIVPDFSPGHRPDPAAIIPFVLLSVLGNLVMMFCFLNNNYVVAKTLKMAELQRKVDFSDFVGDFFFLLIFPVAIWFLQPRINKIVNSEFDGKKVRFKWPSEKDFLDF